MSAPVPVTAADIVKASDDCHRFANYIDGAELGWHHMIGRLKAIAALLDRLAHTPAAVDDASVVERMAESMWLEEGRRASGRVRRIVWVEENPAVREKWRGLATAALAAIPQAREVTRDIPDGWRLVPVEPTQAAIEAGYAAYARKADDIWAMHPTEEPDAGGGAMGYAYRAMLAAAPAPPATAGGAS